MNDDDIKDLLDSTAPAGPDLPAAARADAVRGRARASRRRNGLVLAAAVVAIVGIGAGVAVVDSGDEPGRSVDVAGDPQVSETPPVECPAEPAVIADDGSSSAADFPDGATSMRFCPATFPTQQGDAPFELPTGVVSDDVDTWIDRIRAQPAWSIPDDCALISIMPMPWTLVVGYADGSTVQVGSTTTICSSVTIDGKEIGSEFVLAIADDAIPADATPSADTLCSLVGDGSSGSVQTPTSDPDTYDGPVADLDVTDAQLCYGSDPLGTPEYASNISALTGADLDVVLADLRAHTTATPQVAGRCTDTGPVRLLVLAGDQGQLSLTNDSCTSEFAFAGGYWLPSEASERAIAAALNGPVGG